MGKGHARVGVPAVAEALACKAHATQVAKLGRACVAAMPLLR